MKIAAFFLASAMWLGVAGSAHAQSMTPEASTKLGDCGYGCLVLVNDSENSDIVGFYIREGHSDRKHGGSVRFVENIFRPQVEAVGVPMGQDFRLYPHKAWWMPLPRSGPVQAADRGQFPRPRDAQGAHRSRGQRQHLRPQARRCRVPREGSARELKRIELRVAQLETR
ncbi:MAG: hypothetical protein WDN44_13640 [Sphingomonas sp.]